MVQRTDGTSLIVPRFPAAGVVTKWFQLRAKETGKSSPELCLVPTRYLQLSLGAPGSGWTARCPRHTGTEPPQHAAVTRERKSVCQTPCPDRPASLRGVRPGAGSGHEEEGPAGASTGGGGLSPGEGAAPACRWQSRRDDNTREAPPFAQAGARTKWGHFAPEAHVVTSGLSHGGRRVLPASSGWAESRSPMKHPMTRGTAHDKEQSGPECQRRRR